MTVQKKILIIAGPSGAGKTTFAREFLPNEGGCPVFVDADLIAAGISPFQPEAAAFRAGRLMLQEVAHHAAHGISFAFETTLAGLTYARMIDAWRTDGYTIKLIFLALGPAEEERFPAWRYSWFRADTIFRKPRYVADLTRDD
jgi:predicted ABC-type ATPase